MTILAQISEAITPESLGILLTGVASVATAVGSFVYARTRDATVRFYKEQVKDVTTEKDHWKGRHEADRQEIHDIRDRWNQDRLELERLRVETNFSPVEAKLTAFMEVQSKHVESQNQFNAKLVDRLDEMGRTHKQQTDTFIKIMERLVPPLTADQIKEQEEPL